MIKPTVVNLPQSLNQASGIIFHFAGSHALFDKNSCGNNFYDSTKLSTIPLSNLKKIPEHEIKPVAAWGVQADSIIRWVAP